MKPECIMKISADKGFEGPSGEVYGWVPLRKEPLTFDDVIEEAEAELRTLFKRDGLELINFRLSPGRIGWMYYIKFEDDGDVSGVVPYGTSIEKLVLTVYEDLWERNVFEDPWAQPPVEALTDAFRWTKFV